MKIKLLDKNEVTLKTKDKVCKEDITLVVNSDTITSENIKSGVNILGVIGTYSGSGGGEGYSDEEIASMLEGDY